MCNRLDTIPACDVQTDGRTDRQTSCHGIVRTMRTRRAVKIVGTLITKAIGHRRMFLFSDLTYLKCKKKLLFYNNV